MTFRVLREAVETKILLRQSEQTAAFPLFLLTRDGLRLPSFGKDILDPARAAGEDIEKQPAATLRQPPHRHRDDFEIIRVRRQHQPAAGMVPWSFVDPEA